MKIQIPPDAGLNTQKAFRDVEQELSDLTRRINDLPKSVTQNDLDSLRAELKRLIRKPVYSTWEEVFGSFLGKHNILSVQHADTLIGTLTRGDVLRVNSTPKLERYPKGTAGWVVGYDANDVLALDRRVVRTTADTSTTSTSLIDITGLNFPVLADIDYIFQFHLVHQVTAGERLRLAVNGPASPTLIGYAIQAADTDTTAVHRSANSYDAYLQITPDAGATNRMAVVQGILRNGSNAGTLTMRLSSAGGASVTVVRGSGGWIMASAA